MQLAGSPATNSHEDLDDDVCSGSEPDVARHDFGMYIPIGAPDEMKLGTAMSLLRLLISEITARRGKVRFAPQADMAGNY